MEDIITRIFENLSGRVSGPMQFRIYFQPLMATIFAVIAGHRDVMEEKPAYFWALLTDPEHRKEMAQDGWRSVGKVFLFAIALDIVYQLIVHRWVYPGEVLLTALILAVIPYICVRGPISQIEKFLRWVAVSWSRHPKGRP